MIRFLTVCTLFLFLFTGCQRVFDFPANGEYKKVLVIEAIITDDADHQMVRVSYTTTFEDSLSAIPIDDAQVKIASSTGDTIQFNYTENGWYTSKKLIVAPENRYTLLVQTDTTTYRASSSMVVVNGLDSATYQFYQKEGTNKPAYYLALYGGTSDPGNPKHYRIQVYKNHQLITTGSNTLLFSDIYTQSLNGIELDQQFALNDTIDIEVYSLTKEMFYYYFCVYNEILFNFNYDLEFNTNPPIQFIPTALGYFQVSAYSRKRVIIK